MVTKLAGRDAYSYNPNIRLGQKSLVEITAYNSVTFGWMMGEVVSISPDAIYDEALKESFYSVQVRTTGSPLKDSKGKRQLFIYLRTEADKSAHGPETEDERMAAFNRQPKPYK